MSSARIDVIAEIGLDRGLGVGALFKREGCVLEFLDHTALGEIAEIAAVGLVRIGGLFLRQIGEVLAGVQLLDDVLGFGFRLHRDVAGANCLLRKGGDFLVVASLDVGVGDRVGDVLLEVGVMQLSRSARYCMRFLNSGSWSSFSAAASLASSFTSMAAEGGDLLLVVGQLAQLRVEVGNGQIEFRLQDVDVADLGDNWIRLVLRAYRCLKRNKSCKAPRRQICCNSTFNIPSQLNHRLQLRESSPETAINTEWQPFTISAKSVDIIRPPLLSVHATSRPEKFPGVPIRAPEIRPGST